MKVLSILSGGQDDIQAGIYIGSHLMAMAVAPPDARAFLSPAGAR